LILTHTLEVRNVVIKVKVISAVENKVTIHIDLFFVL
jgi:hypothetical protein